MTLTIRPFSSELASNFDRLNRIWIEDLFVVEPFDDQVLKNPQAMIVDKGGEVWFAELNGEIVGVCALLPLEDGGLEFTKLGVAEKARGQGIARALMRHCYDRARAMGVSKITLLTSRKLTPANALYVSEGFKEIHLSPELQKRYKRCDIIYELELTP